MAKSKDKPKQSAKSPKAKREDPPALSLRQRTRSGARGGRGRR